MEPRTKKVEGEKKKLRTKMDMLRSIGKHWQIQTHSTHYSEPVVRQSKKLKMQFATE